jgi:hypothetical protein
MLKIMHTPESITTLISKLRHAGEAVGFTVECFGQIGNWPLLGMIRPASVAPSQAPHIYLSAGTHGDEPAGPQAMLELLKNDRLPRNYNYSICPLLNPAGLALGTRENPGGIDLNRDYRDSISREVRSHTRWIEHRITQLDCAIHLHEDWESQGFYLYELNITGLPSYSAQILAATEKFLPIETAQCIDGHLANEGIIKPTILPELAEGQPEAVYLQEKFGGLNYTLEAPSALDFRKRVNALKAAVEVTLPPQKKPHTDLNASEIS